MSKPLNYTTIIEPEQTIAEIQRLLADFGVEAMMTEYDGRQVSAVSFKMRLDGNIFPFRMPCNWRAVRKIFDEKGVTRGHIKHKDKDLDNQSIRTAWRILLVWIEAQLNLVEINMVTIPQVFLPYAIMADDRTLSEHVADNPGFLLEGKPDGV